MRAHEARTAGFVTVIAPHVRRHVVVLTAIVVLQICGASALLVLPSLNARVIDEGLLQGDIGLTGHLGALMVGVTLAHTGLVIGVSYLSAKMSSSMAARLRHDLYSTVVRSEPEVVARYRSGSLLTRVTGDVQQIQATMQALTSTVVSAPVMIFGASVFSYLQQPRMFWLVAVTAAALVVVIVAFAWATIPDARRVQERADDVMGVLREQLGGFRPIRLFLRERHESHRFAASNDALTSASWRLSRYMVGLPPVVFLLVNLSTVAAVGWSAGPVVAGDIGIGEVLAFITYMVYVLNTAVSAVLLVMLLPQAQVSGRRIHEVLSERPTTTDPSTPTNDPATLGHDGIAVDRLSLTGLTCHLPGAVGAAIDGIDLTMLRGEFVAVVGSTGSGKTTLARTVAGLVPPTSGSITADPGETPLGPSRLRSTVAFVPQAAYLFSGTIRSNIAFGAPDSDDELLWSALGTAQAADLVRETGGLDAPVAPGGSNFSGGQRQRLCLARALVVDRPVLMMDDTVSAVDSTTERQLLGALRESGGSRLTVLVTQRMSAAASADHIVVLDQGRVVGVGTFDQLIDDCEEFRQLQSSQTAEAVR